MVVEFVERESIGFVEREYVGGVVQIDQKILETVVKDELEYEFAVVFE